MIESVRGFLTFSSHFVHACYVLRQVLGAQLATVIGSGMVFALAEKLPVLQGIYFSMITATTVGYGDITPQTGLGRCLSVFIAFVGTIHFGLVVAVATHAFSSTIKEQIQIPQQSAE